MSDNLTFERLVDNVGKVHNITSNAAKGAVNQLLTMRNWTIGYYIVEFEQNGSDRAEYGSQLLKRLEERLDTEGMNRALFYKCRIFYQRYPQIFSMVSKKLGDINEIDNMPLLIEAPFGRENDNKKFSTASKKFTTDAETLVLV